MHVLVGVTVRLGANFYAKLFDKTIVSFILLVLVFGFWFLGFWVFGFWVLGFASIAPCKTPQSVFDM